MDIPPTTRIRCRLAAACVALAIVLTACSDATPAEEVRADGSGASRGGATGNGSIQPGLPADTSTSAPGVGDTPPGADGGSGSDGGQPGQVEPSPPAGGNAPPPGEALPPVRTVPGDGRHPQPWDGHTVGGDGRTLTFTYYAGVAPCSIFDSIVAEEGPDAVRVTIYEHSGPEGVACIMLAQQKSASVTLAAPLGGRRLVDGAIPA